MESAQSGLTSNGADDLQSSIGDQSGRSLNNDFEVASVILEDQDLENVKKLFDIDDHQVQL